MSVHAGSKMLSRSSTRIFSPYPAPDTVVRAAIPRPDLHLCHLRALSLMLAKQFVAVAYAAICTG
jgi:hypothetical protein